jgi:demethylmenaquinone methyltransferase / 2-methoxy-6-polyprenyl-1,4-benzoquinol methylase
VKSHCAEVEIVNRFFSGTGSSYDYMVNLATFGFDIWWKKKILDRIPRDPARIIDQASGTGILTFRIARRFPRCRVFGVELREEYLKIAQEKRRTLQLRNAGFILGRAEDVFLGAGFDCITSSYLAKYAELETLVRNAKRMLRSGGVLIMHDFTYPRGLVFPRIWEFYFRLLQTAGAWKYPQWRTIFDELPCLLRETRWVPELEDILKRNAFSHIHAERLTLGTSTLVTATNA